MNVTIGITAHNCINFSKLTLESVFNETYACSYIDNLRYIVADNASTDGSREYFASRQEQSPPGKFIALLFDQNFGCSKSFNEIFRRTQEDDYVVLINNDIVPSHHWLVGLIEYMEKNGEVGIGSCHPVDNQVTNEQKYKWFGNPNDPNFVYTAPTQDWFDYARNIEVNEKDITDEGIHGCSLIFRRDCIDAVGYFDEGFKRGCWEDIDYNMRAYKAGFTCMTTHSAVIQHFGGTTQTYIRVHEGNNSYQEANRQYFMRKYNTNLNGIRTGRSMLWTDDNKKVIL